MNREIHIRRIHCPLTPLDALRCWPAERPVVLLHSGGSSERWCRWSVVASPRAIYRHHEKSFLTGTVAPCALPREFSHDALADLELLLRATRGNVPVTSERFPFIGGWLGYLSYDLGRIIEPTARHRPDAMDEFLWPLVEFAWCPDALVFDHAEGQWWSVERGEEFLEDLQPGDHSTRGFQPSPIHPSWTRDQHEAAVRRAIDYIAAGDIFQANIAGRMTAGLTGSPRALACRALSRTATWYGAHLEFDGRCLLSLSPELFLQFDAESRMIRTRPMKGTRPINAGPDELLRSQKDAAELAMIVDLMRNDLGRVCEFGSVRVVRDRTIERHPTVWQASAEVEGRVRDGRSLNEILRATFPPGSVTGAPKIRAMQIIDELEPVRRGPYCGAIGAISRCGSFRFNVAIRTLLLTASQSPGHWRVDYSAGGGIVSDSVPAEEFEEAQTKARVFHHAMRTLCPTTVTPDALVAHG